MCTYSAYQEFSLDSTPLSESSPMTCDPTRAELGYLFFREFNRFKVFFFVGLPTPASLTPVLWSGDK